MGMGFAPTWLRQVSPPPLHMTTLTTEHALLFSRKYILLMPTVSSLQACRRDRHSQTAINPRPVLF